MTSSLTALATEPEVALQATDAARNIRRGYTITRAPDLFGWHIVSWSWGRIDGRPRLRAQAFRNEAEAIAFARRLLARRATAPRRIGVAYRPIGLPASPSRQAEPAQRGA